MGCIKKDCRLLIKGRCRAVHKSKTFGCYKQRDCYKTAYQKIHEVQYQKCQECYSLLHHVHYNPPPVNSDLFRCAVCGYERIDSFVSLNI